VVFTGKKNLFAKFLCPPQPIRDKESVVVASEKGKKKKRRKKKKDLIPTVYYEQVIVGERSNNLKPAIRYKKS